MIDNFADAPISARSFVFELISEERERQNKKFPNQPHDPLLMLPILMEEIGELAQEILRSMTKDGLKITDNYYVELIQCAAVLVKWAEAAYKEKENFGGYSDGI